MAIEFDTSPLRRAGELMREKVLGPKLLDKDSPNPQEVWYSDLKKKVDLERRQFNEFAPPGQIRILAWNVLHESTPAEIVETITQIEAEHGLVHVACLQEMPVPVDTLEKGKSDQLANWVGKGMLRMRESFATPQYWLKDNRRDKSAKGREEEWVAGPAIWSRYGFVPGSETIHKLSEGKGGPDFYRQRYGHALLLTAGIQIPGRSDPLVVGDYHLSTSSEMPWNRSREVRNLAEVLSECDLAFGDANANPRSRYAQTIFEALPRCDGGTDEHTYEDTFGPLRVKRRLDYGSAKPGIEVSSTLIKDKGRSDHYPRLYVVNV